ncbi:MAG: diaminopimelate epimerase [Thermogutta sp.]
MQFTKMHGIGNDYVFVDCFQQSLPEAPEALAPKIADRHFGVGGDGLILILPSQVADARMRIFNADGSEAEMCGNGVRCVAKYVYEHGIARKNPLKIETGRGLLTLHLELTNGLVQRVSVDMGEPILEPARIPVQLNGNAVIEHPLTIGDLAFAITCVSMGNPHCVLFLPQVDGDLVTRIGPQLEKHPLFPNRTNVEFVQVVSPSEVRMRVWERGSGETLACGTGACAVCVAGALTNRLERAVMVHLLGGDLQIEWESNGHVLMTGPAEEVFTGNWPS